MCLFKNLSPTPWMTLLDPSLIFRVRNSHRDCYVWCTYILLYIMCALFYIRPSAASCVPLAFRAKSSAHRFPRRRSGSTPRNDSPATPASFSVVGGRGVTAPRWPYGSTIFSMRSTKFFFRVYFRSLFFTIFVYLLSRWK